MTDNTKKLEEEKKSIDSQLTDLKQQIFLVKEKEKKQELEAELKKLEEESKKIETKMKSETESEISSLKSSIEQNQTKSIFLDISKESGYYDKLKNTFNDDTIYPELNFTENKVEKKIEKFSNNINKTIKTYLESRFLKMGEKEFPPLAIQSMSTGIQFVLMETLGKQTEKENEDFFNSFKNGTLDSIKTIAEGLFGAFNKGSLFLISGQAITKTIDFLSLQTVLRNNAEKIPQIMNPYKFIELLKNPKIQTEKDPSNLTLNDFGIEEGDISISAEEKAELKKILENGNISPKTTKGIIGSLDYAQKFLEKRKDLSSQAINIMDMADGLIGPFKNMFGIDTMDILKPFEGVLNFLLGILGFSGGIDGLQKNWLKRKLEEQLSTTEKKDFFKNAYLSILNNIRGSTMKEDHSRSMLNIYQSRLGPITSPEIKNKIPLDYDIIKNSIEAELKDLTIINPEILYKLKGPWTNYIKKEKNSKGEEIETINKEKISGKEKKFVSDYMNYIIPTLINNNDFMTKINGKDEFFLAIVGGIVIKETVIVDGIKTNTFSKADLGLKQSTTEETQSSTIEETNDSTTQETQSSTTEETNDSTTQESSNTPNSPEKQEQKANLNQNNLDKSKKLSNLTFVEAKIFAENVFGGGPATDLLIHLSENDPSMILRTVALAKHEGGLVFQRRNIDPSGKQQNIGTFQISSARNVDAKYKSCLLAGKNLAISKGILFDESQQLSPGQSDLLSWLGYINKDRGGEKIFSKLRDPNLSENELKTLMHRKIQGGIAAIGKSVVSQINNKSVGHYYNESNNIA